jgi:hypothetical protein
MLPKELYINPKYKGLDATARELYTILLDRLNLSIENKWSNEAGEAYVMFTRENLMELMGISDKTLKKAFNELEAVELVKEECQGRNKPNFIFVAKAEQTDVNIFNNNKNLCMFAGVPFKKEASNPYEDRTRRNYGSRHGEFPDHDTENFRPNYTNGIILTTIIHNNIGKNLENDMITIDACDGVNNLNLTNQKNTKDANYKGVHDSGNSMFSDGFDVLLSDSKELSAADDRPTLEKDEIFTLTSKELNLNEFATVTPPTVNINELITVPSLVLQAVLRANNGRIIDDVTPMELCKKTFPTYSDLIAALGFKYLDGEAIGDVLGPKTTEFIQRNYLKGDINEAQ